MARGTNYVNVSSWIDLRNRSGSHEHERPVGRAYSGSGAFADVYHGVAVAWDETAVMRFVGHKKDFFG